MHAKPTYEELELQLLEIKQRLADCQQAESDTRQIEDKFKNVFESASVGKSITLPDGTINVNTAFADMLGYTRAELSDLKWQKLTPDDDVEQIEKSLEPVVNGDLDSIRFDKRYLHKDGSVIWTDISISACRDAGGKMLYFITTVVDITERYQTEGDLKQSEANLYSLINNRNESIWSIDNNSNYLIFNNFFKDDYLKAFGIQLEKGLNALEILDPELRKFWKSKYDKVLAGEHLVFELSNPVAGVDLFYEVSLNPITTDNQISGVSAISVDMTDRKQTADALIKQSADMLAIMENTQDSIWTINTAYEIVYMNSVWKDAFLASFGVDLRPGLFLLEALPEPLRPIWKEHYDRTLANERFEIVEEIDLGPRSIYVEVSFNPIVVNNTVVGASVFGRDITERKLSEIALRESEERFRILSAMTSEGIMIHQAGHILDANQAFANLTGYESPKDLIGLNGMEVLPLTPESAARIHEHMISGEIESYDIELQSADGQTIPAETMGTPISYRGQDARLIRMRDISDRKLAEVNRLALEHKLLQTQKLESLGVLAGGIAHDFNNILMGILGYADLALSSLAPSAPAWEYVQGINDSSRKAAALIKQMLAYSGKGKFSLESINLNHLIQDTVQMLTISISKNVLLRFNYSKEPIFMEGDPSQIRQILMNLVINSSDSIGEKSGVISLTTGKLYCDQEFIDNTGFEAQLSLSEKIPEGMYLFLEVSDTGTGMSKDTLHRIFEPFFTTKFTGRGLGLSAVLGIVAGHHGMVTILSEDGKGTTFKVLFPLIQDSQSRLSLADETPENTDKWLGQGTFLIADDEEAIRTVGKHMLKKLGYDVLTASNGREAVKIFKSNAAKIVGILMDLTMPHKDGVEVFREVRKLNPNIKVILSSGYDELDACQQFVGKGLAGFIQKPYVARDLVKKIKEVMGKDSNE